MANLTSEQKTLLTWMKAGNTFDVCSEYCPMKDTIHPNHALPVRVFSNTLNKLVQQGWVTYHSTRIYGVRWDRFSLTDKGSAFVC